MRIRGVLLQTVDEQTAGDDDEPVDPTCIPDSDHLPVHTNVEWTHHVGKARLFHDGVGRLLFEATILDIEYALPPFAAYVGTKEHCIGISLVDRNRNANQPPYEIVR